MIEEQARERVLVPKLVDLVIALKQHQGRYEYLDAFVDDIDEIRNGVFRASARLVEFSESPKFVKFATTVHCDRVLVKLFPRQGIARIWQDSGRRRHVRASRAAVGAMIDGAIGAASKVKEGLLGGLVLGMLVGTVAGKKGPIERVLALRFEPIQRDWRLYDGPLLRWAKRTLQPVA